MELADLGLSLRKRFAIVDSGAVIPPPSLAFVDFVG